MVALLWSGPSLAATVHAVRTDHPIQLDGRLDEPAWQQAPAFTAFVDSYPVVGARPSERTVAKVVYDDAAIYVGVVCYDDHPALIGRELGRRDNIPTSDLVVVALDSQHDHRTALQFLTNAAGVQSDGIIYDDVNETSSWNAVWDSAVATLPDGWSVEFAIPLHLLRFGEAPEQVWGLEIRRKIARTHEDVDLSPMPRSANGFVSLFANLDGLSHLEPQKDLELTPYVAARASLQPRYLAEDRPQPRLWNPSLDVGLNLKASLGRSLTLNAALNPDFGEIEPDALQINLSSYELFFPEMRPFFTQGLELFSSSVSNWSDQRLFYSRRIGLDAPILAAAKLTGDVTHTLSLSVLDTVVMGAADPAKQPYAYGAGADPDAAPLDRRLQLHWATPFHLGLNNELPAQRPVTTNYLALAGRQKLGNASSMGLTLTSATPLAKRCERSDFLSDADYQAEGCDAGGGNALAVDWNLRSSNGDWAAVGQVAGSQITGGPTAGLIRDDGTVLKSGDLGLGGFLRAGKLGGEPWQFNLTYEYESPTLELNRSGFQSDSNRHRVSENVYFTRPNGFGALHSFDLWLNAQETWSADGRGIPRYAKLTAGQGLTFPNYLNYSFELGYERLQYDIREVGTTGIPLERNGDVYAVINASSDSNKPLQLGGSLLGFTLVDAPSNGPWGYHVDVWGQLRPVDSLETYLEVSFNANPQGVRYIDTLAPGRFVFAPQNPDYASVTFRQSWILSPKLTLQAYAQLFSAYAHYGPFYEGTPGADGKIRLSSLTPSAYAGNPDFHSAALNVNVVARWEYRLGSTLFLVYSRAQTGLPFAEGKAPLTFYPENLAHGRTSDTFLVKWSYWWDA